MPAFVSDSETDLLGGQSCCPNSIATLFVGLPTTVIFTDNIDAPTWQYTIHYLCDTDVPYFEVFDVNDVLVGTIGASCFFDTYVIFVVDSDLNSIYGSGWACGAVPIDPPPDDIFVWFAANTDNCSGGISQASIHCVNDFDLPDPPT